MPKNLENPTLESIKKSNPALEILKEQHREEAWSWFNSAVKKISDPEIRSHYYTYAYEIQKRTEFLESAFETAMVIKSFDDRLYSYLDLTKANKFEALDLAILEAEKAPPLDRARSYLKIAQSLNKPEFLKLALQAIDEYKSNTEYETISNKDNVYEKVVEVATDIDNVEFALQVAEKIQRASSRISAYLEIAEAGRPEAADVALQAAQEYLVENSKSLQRDHFGGTSIRYAVYQLSRIAKFDKPEAFEKVMQLAGQIDLEHYPDAFFEIYLKDLVSLSGKPEALEFAFKSAERITDATERTRAYVEMSKLGKPDALVLAYESAKEINDPYDQAYAYVKVAQSGKTEAINDALNSAEKIEDFENKVTVYSEIAKLGKPEILELALKPLTEIEKSNALIQKAYEQEYAKAGVKLISAAKFIDNRIEKSYSKLIESALEINNLDLALKVAERISGTTNYEKSKAYLSIANAALRSGNFDVALKSAENVNHPYDFFDRVLTYLEIAKSGKPKILDKAFKIAKEKRGSRVVSPYDLSMTYLEVAKAGKSEALTLALETAAKIYEPYRKAKAFLRIAEFLERQN